MKSLASQVTRLLYNVLCFICKAVIPKQENFAKPLELKLKVWISVTMYTTQWQRKLHVKVQN